MLKINTSEKSLFHLNNTTMQKIFFLSLLIITQTIAISQPVLDSSTTRGDSIQKEKMYELVDGTWINQQQLDSIFQKAWDNSFGKMTEEENELLFGGITITVETQPIKKEDEN